MYRLGDGELAVISEVDIARQTIHATPNEIYAAVEQNLNGSGIIVGVMDSGIRHDTAFDGRILSRVVCDSNGCVSDPATNVMGNIEPSLLTSSHGTRVAQILGASGLPMHNGIAPGVEFLDIHLNAGSTGVAHGLDYAHKNGADVVNMSFRIHTATTNGFCQDSITRTTSLNLIVNEAVDRGMVAVKSAGNEGRMTNPNQPVYESITNPGCGNNSIVVGGINDRNPNTITMYLDAGRGPVGGTMILKPEIVASAHLLNVLNFSTGPITDNFRSGTSYAAPQVSATAAMMLQIEPHLTPAEVKAGLLLGATWQGPIPCTSSQYEQNNTADNCSFAMQPSDFTLANNATSLEILNNVGFGILNTSQSLKYVHSPLQHVISDYLDTTLTSKQYTFTVSDTSDPVKVILTWMTHPHGSIIDQVSRTQPVPAANLDFTITLSNGTDIAQAQSMQQTNEFTVFSPPFIGTYNITVTGSGLDSLNKTSTKLRSCKYASTYHRSSNIWQFNTCKFVTYSQ